MGVNGPNLQDLFNQRFGAGSYEAGVNNAYNAGRAIWQAKQQEIQQKLFEQYQKQMEDQQKAEAKQREQDIEDRRKDPMLQQQNANSYWSNPQMKQDLLQNGAFRTVKDLMADPEKIAALKSQGYDINAIADQAYNVASDGKYKSAKAFDQYYKDLSDSTDDERKANLKTFDTDVQMHQAQVQAQQDEAQKQADFNNSTWGHVVNGAKSLFSDPYHTLENVFNGINTAGERFDNQMVGTLFPKLNAKANQGQADLLQGMLKKNPNDALAQTNLNQFNNSHSEAQTPFEKMTNLAGGFAGNALPYMVGDGLIGAVGKVGGSVLGKTIANPILEKALSGALSGTVGSGIDMGAKAAVDGQHYSTGDVTKNLLENALIGGGGNVALHGLTQGLNLKGQLAKVLDGSAKYDPAAFEQALKETYSPSGNVSNVLADTTKEIPKPFEQKYNIPQQTPQAKPQMNADVLKQSDWFGFGQQGNNLSRGLHVDPTVPKGQSGAVRSLADETLNRANTFHNSPTEGFNQRLLNVQQDMKGLQNNAQSIANQHGGTYKPDVESLYQQVKQPNDPKTFDELVKMAQMEHGANNPSLTSMLQQDPKVKAGIDALNSLGKGATKKAETVKQSNVLKGLNIPEVKGPKQQNIHDFLKAAQVDRSIKPGGNGSLLMPLKPTVLESVKVNKSLHTMSKGELQDIMSKLEKQESLAAGDETKLKAIESDKKKVSDLMMKLDLQQFGANAEKLNPIEAVREKLKGKAPEKTPQQAAIERSQQEAATKKIQEKGGTINANTVSELQKIKDIKPHQTLGMNLYEAADRLPKEMGDRIKTALDTAKANHIDNLEQRSNELYNKIVDDPKNGGLGIKKGSKESALVQDFGEKTLAKNYLEKKGEDPSKLSKEELDKINLEQLKAQHPNNWKKIVEADKFFRDNYNKMIDEVNKTVKEIYPNNPDKIVPKREDYYHHFNELEGFEGFKNLLANDNHIDPHLAGISANTKPKTKFAGFKLARGNGAYKSDAVGGYLKYMEAASHSTHVDPVIPVIRNVAEQLATATESTKNANNLKAALEYHANDIAGKTNPLDRVVQDNILGRKGMQIVNTVNGHIKKNLILGNVGSVIGQVGNIPLTIGKAKQYAGQGTLDTLKDMAAELIPGVKKDISSPINQSEWLKERFKGKLFSRFDQGLLKKPEKMAAWMLEMGDKSGTYLAWNSMYRKGVAKGVADPIKYADEQARHIIAGRGIGEVPIYQKSKITGLVAPFSLEVGNAWKVLGKQMNEKDFGGVITFLAASAVLNEGMRQLRGSDVSFNPIGAALDGINKDKTASATDKAKLAGANVLGEIIGNIPGGSYIPQLLGKINSDTKKSLFGDNSPDRYGTGVGVTSAVVKPFMDAIGGNWENAGKDALAVGLPFGGNQAKKTVNGIEALLKGGAYDSKGRLEYPVDSNNAADLLHSILLGPSTTAQGQKYFKTNGRALSDKDTATFQNMQQTGQGQDYFDSVTKERAIKEIDKKIKTVMKDPDLSLLDKQKELMRLQQVRLQAMQQK